MAEKDFNRGNRKGLIDYKINKDDKTTCSSSIPDPPDETATPNESIHHGPVTFNSLPPIAVDEDTPLAATADQAKLMQ